MSIETMPLLAAVRYEQGFDINETLRRVVARLRDQEMVVGGVLQEIEAKRAKRCASLSVVDIRSEKRASITQDRGSEARGCKLDARGLVSIAHCVDNAIGDRVGLIVINRFGRAESEGGGFLSCISDVGCAGIPVLTAVREPYVESWREFHGGLGTELSPCIETIVDWCARLCRLSDEMASAYVS
jgi:nucleoside-triphosphatase THEP1